MGHASVRLPSWHDCDMTQPMTLTDEQREFRAVVRQFADAKIAPLAGEIDRSAEY